MYTTVEHHHDAIRHHHRLSLVVGDINRGDTNILLQVANEKPHLLAQFGIEVGQWFIEQQDTRLYDQCPGQRYPLLLTPAELVGVTIT